MSWKTRGKTWVWKCENWVQTSWLFLKKKVKNNSLKVLGFVALEKHIWRHTKRELCTPNPLIFIVNGAAWFECVRWWKAMIA